MPVAPHRSRRFSQVVQIPVDLQTRLLVLESHFRELREQQASGNLTELQQSLISTELDLLRIAMEHCHALLGLEQMFDISANTEQGERDLLDDVLAS